MHWLGGKMKNMRQGRFLRIAFLLGAFTDVGAILPMLFPSVASALWGFRDTSGTYRFAMGYGASLMLGWTVLLLWAYRLPLERRFVAPLTALVIGGLVITEVVAVISGTLGVLRMTPTWCLQIVMLTLFVTAYCHPTSGRQP